MREEESAKQHGQTFMQKNFVNDKSSDKCEKRLSISWSSTVFVNPWPSMSAFGGTPRCKNRPKRS